MAVLYAKSVCYSDYLEEAVATMARSARHLQLSNVTSRLLDWNHLSDDLTADALLLTDIHYDPGQIEQLYQVLQRFLQQATIILLSPSG